MILEDKKWDVVIIGGGPSGYTAALYLARATLSVLVLAGVRAGGQLMNTTEVENFPGFKDGVMGPDLMMTMEAQAKKFGAEVEYQEVTKVDLKGEIKKIWIGEREVRARSVIVSTGAKAKMLGLGEEKWLGKGVSTCAVCDAAFFRDKVVVVVGGGDAAMEDALALAKYASEVRLIHRKDEFRASKIMQERVKSSPKIKIVWKSEVVRVQGEDKLHSIEIKNSRTQELKTMEVDGLFLAIGHFPATELFEGQADLDERGFLKTGITRGTGEIWLEGYPTMTSTKGVFGAGDVVDFRYKQAITAAGMGCQAALDAERYLTGKTSSY